VDVAGEYLGCSRPRPTRLLQPSSLFEEGLSAVASDRLSLLEGGLFSKVKFEIGSRITDKFSGERGIICSSTFNVRSSPPQTVPF